MWGAVAERHTGVGQERWGCGEPSMALMEHTLQTFLPDASCKQAKSRANSFIHLAMLYGVLWGKLGFSVPHRCDALSLQRANEEQGVRKS